MVLPGDGLGEKAIQGPAQVMRPTAASLLTKARKSEA